MKDMTRKDWWLFAAMMLLIIFAVTIANAEPPKQRKLRKNYYSTCASYKNLEGVRHHVARRKKIR